MRIKKLFCCLLFLLFGLDQVEAQVTYEKGSGILTIGKSVDYFIDSSASKQFSDIRENVAFKKFDKSVPNMGLVSYPVWLRLGIKNASERNSFNIEVAQALLDTIEFYYPVEDGKYAMSKAGEAFPFNIRQVKNHNFVYDINIEPGETKYYYLRIKSEDKLELPIFLGNKRDIVHSDLSKNILF